MRAAWGIVLLLLFSGCINTSMNAPEIAACIHATHTQIVDVPDCKTNEACVEKWNDAVNIPTFTHFPVKKEMVETQHHIIQAWNALRNAQTFLEKANAACEKGNPIQIIQHGLPAAGAIQTALQSTEKSHWTTLAALHATAERASKEELERIKDTKMYQHYAEVLQILHSLATGNETDPWGKEWGKNQQYYEEIGHQLTTQPLPAATFDWKDTFAWYDTGIGIAYPEKKKTIIWFSTVWKSALTSFTKNKSKNTIVALMQSIQAEEMMQSVEVSVSPKNGLIVHAVALIAGMENEWHALEETEIEKIGELKKEIDKWKDSQLAIENETEKKQDEWKKLEPFFDAHHVSVMWKEEGWNNQYVIHTEWAAAANDANEKTKPIGQRIERIRKIEKWVNDWKLSVEKQEQLNMKMEEACIQLGEKMGIGGNANESCAQVASAIEENALANKDELAMELLLSSCVNEVNTLQQALGEETLEPEQFIAEFGMNAALPGCESMKMALHAHYEQQPHTQELIEKWNAWIEKKNALAHAAAIQPTYFSVGKTKNESLSKIEEKIPTLTLEETATLIEKLDEEIEWLDNALLEGLQALVDQERWTIQTPLPTTLEKTESTASLFIPNPFGKSIEMKGVLAVPTPTPEFQVEEETHSEIDGKIVMEDIHLPKTGRVLEGLGTAEWLAIQTKPEILHVIGNEAAMDVRIFIHALADTPNAKWEYTLPLGKISSVSATQEGMPIEHEMNANHIQGTIPIDQPVEEIKLSFTQEGAVSANTTLLKHETTDQEVNTWYEVEIKNNLELDITTNIHTGIITPPSGTYAILTLDESGKSVDYSTGIWGDIVIPTLFLPGNNTRTLSILVSSEIEEGKPFIQEMLEDEIEDWINDEDWNIAAEAQKLWAKITTNTNPEKWPTLAQEVMQLKEKGTHPEATEDTTETTLQTPNPALIEFDSQTEAVLIQAGEWMDKYTRALGITCAKLVETEYHCPIDEKTIKEWKKEWTADTKKVGLIKKQSTSKNATPTSHVLNQEEDEKIAQRWATRMENTRVALGEVKKTAEGIESNLREQVTQDGREDVQDAWEKFTQAMEKGEYGKAIFIGKNLQHYFSSQNRWTGLLNIPPAGWPLVGIILVAGGLFIHNERKKKKIKPIELKPLPTGENKTNPPRAPRDSGGSSPPRTQGGSL